LGRHDPVGQAARRFSGKSAEQLVRDILEKDPKLRGWKFRFTEEMEAGLDIDLTPPNVCKEGQTEGCKLPLHFEAKSVEKLFEHDAAEKWPHSRTSRWVLKQHEEPHCYVLITRDEVTDHTAVDFIQNAGELVDWKKRQGGKSVKLPVRALPRLRLLPCPYVTKAKRVVKESVD